MTPHVRLRPEVPDDVLEIASHLIGDNPVAAQRFSEAIPDILQDLARMPGMGSLKSFRLKRLGNVRTWYVPGFRKYLIDYREITDGIEVLAILHGARNVRRTLRKRT